MPTPGRIDERMASVPPAEYAARNRIAPIVAALRARHEARARENPEFAYFRARKDYDERLRERTHLSLREATRVEQQAADEAWILDVENARLVGRGEEPVADLDELEERRFAEAEAERKPEDDALTLETAAILADVIDLSQPLAMAGGQTPKAAPLAGGAAATARVDEG